jgi:hypothetical protein
MARMLSLKMNDAAVSAVGVLAGLATAEPAGGLAPDLRDRAARGIARRGEVLMWTGSSGNAESGRSDFVDLTGWECADSSFHLEHQVPVEVSVADGVPFISEEGQRILLVHGVAFGLEFSRLVYALRPSVPVRCILAANETCATFRFHQIRQGEHWNAPGLDGYRMEKVIVIDIEPAAG